MKRLIPLALLLTACAPTPDEAPGDTRRDTEPAVAFRITERDLMPEGITYSEATNRFFVSSIFKTKIVQVDAATGAFEDFVGSDVIGLGVLGLITDESAGVLWACANGTRDGRPASTVSRLDLGTGALLASYEAGDTVEHLFNDLALASDGTVYVTDWQTHTLYRIAPGSGAMTVFLSGTDIEHPNGIAVSPDDRYLYVASETRGIRVVDVDAGRVVGELEPDTASVGIDGLKCRDGYLYGIQNEVPDARPVGLLRFRLDATGTRITDVTEIDRGNPLFDIPTTLVIVGDELFFVANSQLGQLRGGEIADSAHLRDYLIVRYPL